jgi:hypothetical protein
MVNGLLFAVVNWYAVSPIGYGGQTVLFFFAWAVLPLLLAFPALPVSVIVLVFKKVRKAAFIILLASVVYLVVGMPAFRIGRAVRMAGFERQADRGRVLVSAIEAYEKTHGRPPSTLQDLAPDFLPEIPSTGMPTYPDWEYAAGEEAHKWNDNPWVLYMKCSSGGINWDMFLYFPNLNYPKNGYGGWLERIGDWAYVHE